MDINGLIEQYGYAALIIGSMAEGETIILLGGVAAHQGLLTFPLVVASVAPGGMIGDQVLFLVGRHFGSALLSRFKKHQKKIAKAKALINRHPYLFVIGSRFMYGFRIVGPIIIGASKLPPKLFIPLNICGVILWATLFTTLGYLGDEVVCLWLHSLNTHLRHWIWLIVAVAVAVVLAAVGVRLWFKHCKKRINL